VGTGAVYVLAGAVVYTSWWLIPVVIVLGILVGVFFEGALFEGRSRRPKQDSQMGGDAQRYRRLSRITAASFWVMGIAMSVGGGYLAFKGLRLNTDDPANWNITTVAFLLFFVGAFFVAIPAADRIEHPLPRVMLIGAGEATPKTVGWLIAHSEGYWHLFDSRHVLLSIPDERVTEARIDDPEISEQLAANSNTNEGHDADRGKD
jgi:hypothetical protein